MRYFPAISLMLTLFASSHLYADTTTIQRAATPANQVAKNSSVSKGKIYQEQTWGLGVMVRTEKSFHRSYLLVNDTDMTCDI